MRRLRRIRYSYPETVVGLVQQLLSHHSVRGLSQLLGIPASVMYRWRAKSVRHNPPVSDRVEKATALAELVVLCGDVILRASNQHGMHDAQTLDSSKKSKRDLFGERDPSNTAAPHDVPRDDTHAESATIPCDPEEARVSLSRRWEQERSPKTGAATRRYVFDADRARPSRGVKARLEAARRKIDSEYFLEIDCAQLAETAQMSRDHFIRMFGDIFGVSPHRYLTRVRVEAAKRLLCCSNEPIDEIAAGVGFRTCQNMNRAFKQTEGASASAFCLPADCGESEP